MDFREATDNLLSRVNHAELAKALGVSVALTRQARLREEANAYRSPPERWRDTVIQLAESRIRHYQNLVEQLRNDAPAFPRRRRSRSTHLDSYLQP
jgi:histidyl-tRNA synthetase